MTIQPFPVERIGSLVSKAKTWNPSREAMGQRIRYIDLGSVDNEGKRITGYQDILAEEAPSRARQLVEAGDILVSTVRPNLNGVARVPEGLNGATASTGFCVLRADTRRIVPEYLFHWVKTGHFVADMEKKATGQSYPAVSDRIITESEIPLPPLEEQRRIAAILDQADTLRRKRQEALSTLDQLEKAQFVEIFGPMEAGSAAWPTRPLEDIVADATIGLVRAASELGPDLPTPYVRMNAINRQGRLDLADVDHTIASDAEIKKYSLKRGDFLFNTRNSRELVGKSAIFDGEDGYIYNNNILRIRFDARVSSRYAAQAFQMPAMRDAIELCKAGTTSVFAIYWKSLRRVLVPLPPLDLQLKYSEFSEAISSQRSLMNREMANLNNFFASLQHRAFRGEL